MGNGAFFHDLFEGFPVNPLIFRDHRDYLRRGLETVSFLRPLRRRLRNIFLPLVVFDLTRNPWVFARFFFLGLYVRDMWGSIY